MRCTRKALLLAPVLLAACAGNPDRRTLAELHHVEPDMTEVQVGNSLDQAIAGYRKFLEDAPESALTPEAMRRLADLKLEKEYGIIGGGGSALPRPEADAAPVRDDGPRPEPARATGIADHSESEEDFERRATSGPAPRRSAAAFELELPGQEPPAPGGPAEAIELYDRILAAYPSYRHNDQVLYQKARAYDELGRPDEAIAVIERLIAEYPQSRRIDEVQFRRAEYFFVRKRYLDAEDAYAAVTRLGPRSEYYELALYKLGWTLYKQELYREALDEYVALLDYKVSSGYDFDRPEDDADEQRTEDTYRVISLSFSSIGGPDAVQEYFATRGERSYEDRIYSHLGEFYLEKLRYHDAAAAYETFVALHPLHRSSPHFGMRVVEIYETGGFPKLVLESKKEFAASYGLQSEYWRHFDVDDAPEVLRYLKSNLKDLASHYHAVYQEAERAEEKPAAFQEALRWYRAFLASFGDDEEAPPIHYRLADLLLEHRDFEEAAREYERTAYDYPEHEQASAAGYAALYAHRENEKIASGVEREDARRKAVASTLRFVDTFPGHEHAATVLAAAVDDLYDMKEFARAIANGRRLLDAFPKAAPAVRRSAWAAIAHSSFDTGAYAEAETAYARVLDLTPAEDDSRRAVIDNLAASIYKQGEQANLVEDYRTAADHFLRIRDVAPTSAIRPTAEYDASAALVRLEDWGGAAAILDAFRQAHPGHELHREATRQMAFVQRKAGNLSRAAEEYQRVATEAEDRALGREALLVAGELYEDAERADRALAVYLEYVEAFPEPVEDAVETRFKIAEFYETAGDEARRHDQLRRIVQIDQAAGERRTDRTRYLAARSALALAEDLYERFEEVELVQPFERNVQEKQRRMDAAFAAFGRLVDYEVGEVTAAATFYMAEVYSEFSRALLESERPADLGEDEMRDYELVLEEEAFPFEERAIDVHEKNLELLAAGIYNRWIERSLGRLGELVPGRYAKFEASSGFIASIDVYAYRRPRALNTAAPEPEPKPESLDAAASPSPEPAPSMEDEVAPAALAVCGRGVPSEGVTVGGGPVSVSPDGPDAPMPDAGEVRDAAPR